MSRELLEEAKRVQQLAVTRYHAGVHIVAVFRYGAIELSADFYNPKDIPLTWTNKYGTLLYLYTVQAADAWQDWEAHEKAKERQGEIIGQVKRSPHGTSGSLKP